ncbi:hypothetical protein [Flavobacterium akiainvivens]|nr:hypothetical protein [Flavobacterium akiainvivens]SFQ54257.1 hypothetical protein SAMN05444144_107118 [Flavobacterium akiainvivens]
MENKDWYTGLTDAQKKSINQGLDDIDADRVLLHADAMKIIRAKIDGLKK